MRILVTGTTGQLGWELQRSLATHGTLLTPGREAFDLSKPEALRSWLDAHTPDLVVNPAAYTAVDKAESEPDRATMVNRDSPAQMAQWCADHGAALIHYSTDYVFDGTGTTPFREDSQTGPVNVYGKSKLAGEEAIRASGCNHLVLRTSWVYAARGSNFLNTMLRVANAHKELRVVDDQIGSPTPARLLADVTARLLSATPRPASLLANVRKTYHVTPAGHTSWHGFAQAIMSLRHELTDLESPSVHAIPTKDYPTPASRPLNSRLDGNRLSLETGLEMPDWHTCLRLIMADRFAHH